MIRELIIKLLLDGVRIPVGVIADILADMDADGNEYISIREIYHYYKRWNSDGE